MFNFFNFGQLTHPKMKQNFLDEGCDVFMNKSEIRPTKRIKGERSKEIPSYQSKIDDTYN